MDPYPKFFESRYHGSGAYSCACVFTINSSFIQGSFTLKIMIRIEQSVSPQCSQRVQRDRHQVRTSKEYCIQFFLSLFRLVFFWKIPSHNIIMLSSLSKCFGTKWGYSDKNTSFFPVFVVTVGNNANLQRPSWF